MDTLDDETKGKIKETIEWALEPIGIKVVGFGDSYEMTHRSKKGDEPWKEWTETLHHVELERAGEKFLETISGLHLRESIMDAVWVMLHDYCYLKDITPSERDIILKRLWSEEFLKLKDKFKKV